VYISYYYLITATIVYIYYSIGIVKYVLIKAVMVSQDAQFWCYIMNITVVYVYKLQHMYSTSSAGSSNGSINATTCSHDSNSSCSSSTGISSLVNVSKCSANAFHWHLWALALSMCNTVTCTLTCYSLALLNQHTALALQLVQCTNMMLWCCVLYAVYYAL
jgi:hypothetical protein